MDNKRKCWSIDEENFQYDSLGELLDNHTELMIGDVVYVGDAVKPDHSELIDVDNILEMMSERAYDIAGEYADNFPNATVEAVRVLDYFLQVWMKAYCTINFYRVKNIKPYKITMEDFE